KDYDDAIAGFCQLIAMEPTIASAYFERGQAHRAKGSHDLSIADFSEAIRLEPKNPLYWYDRANSCYLKMEHDRAIADCNQTISLMPEKNLLALVHLLRSYAFQAKGNAGQANVDLAESKRLSGQ